MNACRFHLTIPSSEIIYVNGILDSYEGIGIMRTANEKTGEITLYSSASCEETVRALLESLKEEGLAVLIRSVDYTDTL